MTTYTYDGNGDRTASTTGGAASSYGYDRDGNLARVTLLSGVEIDYRSDGDGLRQSRSTVTGTKNFTWEIAGALPLLIDDASGAIHYLHADHLGSTRLVTDSAGAVVGASAYTVFGAIATRAGVSTRIGYTGAWVGDLLRSGPTGDVATAVVGFGDGASFGISDWIRSNWLQGSTCTVNRNGFSTAGQVVGTVSTFADFGGAIASGVAKVGPIGDLFNFGAHAAERAAANTGAGGAARYAVDSSGNVTITVRNSSDSFELTEHAAQRATQRGISIDQIENTVGGNGFSYYNKGAGMYQTGYYDPASKVFVGTSGGQVTTVINNVKQNYINNLMNAGP